MSHLSNIKRLLLGMLLTASLYARESFNEYLFQGEFAGKEPPWFTGPLLCPSGHVVPEQQSNYEPYVYWTPSINSYDAHWKPHSTPGLDNLFFQIITQFGVLPATEFDISPQFIYNELHGQHMWRVVDLPLTLAFQLLYDQMGTWTPGIKLRFAANVPLGKYDHLNPKRLTTDGGGLGSWYPSAGVVLTKLYYITGRHYLSWRFFVNYSFGTPINVHGFSMYGGVPSTRGTVYPGNVLTVLGSLEYSLSQNWALAMDVQYQHNNKNRFSGRSPLGTKPTSPSGELFALAPAIEYNWSSKAGIIAGPWFTVAGRNAQAFVCYVVAINISH